VRQNAIFQFINQLLIYQKSNTKHCGMVTNIFKVFNAFFKDVESQTYKIQYRVMLAKYRGRTACDQCQGTRLRPDADYVKIGNKSIGDLLQMTIKNLYEHFQSLKIDKKDTEIAIEF
jgi:excinuclease ABC subunit A